MCCWLLCGFKPFMTLFCCCTSCRFSVGLWRDVCPSAVVNDGLMDMFVFLLLPHTHAHTQTHICCFRALSCCWTSLIYSCSISNTATFFCNFFKDTNKPILPETCVFWVTNVHTHTFRVIASKFVRILFKIPCNLFKKLRPSTGFPPPTLGTIGGWKTTGPWNRATYYYYEFFLKCLCFYWKN